MQTLSEVRYKYVHHARCLVAIINVLICCEGLVCYTDPFCTLEAKGGERHWLIVDLQTAYAHIACMKDSMGLCWSSFLPSCVDLIWPQLVNLVEINCTI